MNENKEYHISVINRKINLPYEITWIDINNTIVIGSCILTPYNLCVYQIDYWEKQLKRIKKIANKSSYIDEIVQKARKYRLTEERFIQLTKQEIEKFKIKDKVKLIDQNDHLVIENVC